MKPNLIAQRLSNGAVSVYVTPVLVGEYGNELAQIDVKKKLITLFQKKP